MGWVWGAKERKARLGMGGFKQSEGFQQSYYKKRPAVLS
jgi:hypothetical protein